MTRERTSSSLRTSLGWIGATAGVALLGLALWGSEGGEPPEPQVATAARTMVPAPEGAPLARSGRKAADAAPREWGAKPAPAYLPPREREPLVVREPTSRATPFASDSGDAPTEIVTAPPAIAPGPEPAPVAPRPQGDLGPKSLISPGLGEGRLVVLPPLEQQRKALLRSADPVTLPDEGSASGDPAERVTIASAATTAPAQAAPSSVVAPAPVAPRPALATAKPRPRPPVSAATNAGSFGDLPAPLTPDVLLPHGDLPRADLFERLPKLRPVDTPDPRILTLEPDAPVADLPTIGVPWLDLPDPGAAGEAPEPAVIGLPALDLLKTFRAASRSFGAGLRDAIDVRSTPEPTTAALLGLGLLGLAALGRRRD